MPAWLIFQLLAIAAMPAAYDKPRARNRSSRAWLYLTFFFGPLTLPALLLLGHRAHAADAA